MKNNLQDIFVPYEESLELKKLGFDEECICTYSEHDRKLSRCPSHNMEDLPILDEPYFWKNSEIHKTNITAPTWEQSFKFFRDKYKIHKNISDFIDDEIGIEWDYEIVRIGTDLNEKGEYVPLIDYSTDESRKYTSYEQARLECLKKLIQIVKTNNYVV